METLTQEKIVDMIVRRDELFARCFIDNTFKPPAVYILIAGDDGREMGFILYSDGVTSRIRTVITRSLFGDTDSAAKGVEDYCSDFEMWLEPQQELATYSRLLSEVSTISIPMTSWLVIGHLMKMQATLTYRIASSGWTQNTSKTELAWCKWMRDRLVGLTDTLVKHRLAVTGP